MKKGVTPPLLVPLTVFQNVHCQITFLTELVLINLILLTSRLRLRGRGVKLFRFMTQKRRERVVVPCPRLTLPWRPVVEVRRRIVLMFLKMQLSVVKLRFHVLIMNGSQSSVRFNRRFFQSREKP